MISWMRPIFFNLLLSGVILAFVAFPAWGISNFIRVQLGEAALIEVPKNWVVLSGNLRTTLDTFVEAKGGAPGSTLNFAANLYDDHGKTIAMVNARFYPNNPMTQADARKVTAADLKEFDVESRKASEAPLKAMGVRVLHWYGSKMQVINGLYILVQEHQQSGAGGDTGVSRVRRLRVWASPRSFTVTLSYREHDATMLVPIIDYMTESLRQE